MPLPVTMRWRCNRGVAGSVAQTNQEFCGDNGQACSSVKDDGNEQRRGAICGLKKEINNDGRARGIMRYSRHGKTTTVSWGTRPVK